MFIYDYINVLYKYRTSNLVMTTLLLYGATCTCILTTFLHVHCYTSIIILISFLYLFPAATTVIITWWFLYHQSIQFTDKVLCWIVLSSVQSISRGTCTCTCICIYLLYYNYYKATCFSILIENV